MQEASDLTVSVLRNLMPRSVPRGGTVANVLQTQVRCAGCHRRLADLVNEIEAGQLILELKCPRCGQPHLEVIRGRPESDR
jgi:hypothetical protein